MLANLDVCLASAMFDRAGEIVHRIGRLYPPGALEMQDIHNKYLHHLVSHMIYSRNRDLVAHAQKWFEVDLKTEDVAPDAITYAWMLKMSLRFVHGMRGDRCVRRYWDLCKDDGIEEDVLTVPILSESELGILSQVSTWPLYMSGCRSDLITLHDRYVHPIFKIPLAWLLVNPRNQWSNL